MNRFNRVVSGGRVLLPGAEPVEVDLAIRDGRIAAIVAPGTPIDADERIDARGLVILPGVVDAHLHLGHGSDISRPRVPEDAARETAAAAIGGVTTIIPYLLSSEPYETIFDEIRRLTEAGARIDFGYHLIISTEAQLASVARYISELGAPTLKLFMNSRGGDGQRLGLPDIDDGFLLRLCEAAAHGGMVCPHPENIELSWVLRDRVKAHDPDGKGGLAAWNASRPPFVEADAVQRAALVARIAGALLYIVHVSSREALEAALHARERGTNIRIETCPHYLTHDTGWTGGDLGKINPPLRMASDREALWRAVADGSIDTIATDHVHRSITNKAGGIWLASPGCPGLETLLPAMLTEGHMRRSIPLQRIGELLATNPASIMGLGHRKGRIGIGMDADLAIVDLRQSWTLERAAVVSSAGYSIYEGCRFQGRILHTLVRGEPALRDGALVAAAIGTGRYMPRQLPNAGAAKKDLMMTAQAAARATVTPSG